MADSLRPDARTMRIQTERCLLRPFEGHDVEDVLAYRNDPEFARFLPHIPQPFTRAHAEAFVALNMSEPWQQFPTFAVVRDGRVIGTVNLDVDIDAATAMLGYAIAREHWGQGIATEVARAVTRWAFTELLIEGGLEWLWASADPGNVRSHRVLHKLGMQQQAESAFGSPANDVVFALRRQDWLSSQAVPFELRTERMHLRRLGAQHLEDLVRLDSDPEVMRYINGGTPTPRERYERELLALMTAWDHEPFGFLAAYEAGEFIGWFHLRPSVADPTVLELGYRLRRASWGRGLATEGGRALVRYTFETLDRTAVDACADPRNAASIRVMVNCGMEPAGTFLHPRLPIEVVRYMVTRR